MTRTYNRRELRRRLFMYSANLICFAAYWIPSRDTFIGRSTSCTRRFRIPEEAQFIGTYAHPFLASDFFSDLDDVLARLQRPADRA